ncbi:holo-ACP synthase [Psychrosphaera aestuarii]|uniref:holo-ACP synthase n=1 Tax=Psychrosphaera aestuarii TaxID=1266052 RepID=UPI001B345427|nr:holo-ACP synthase [Psychrosphaera aestuarii]
MSVLGLGTDIVEIVRVSNALVKSNRLAERVLTETEMTQFLNHNQPDRFLAKRWAAKEAAAKALGTGIGRGISFHHFEISNDELGAPSILLLDAAKEVANQKGVNAALISISDEQNYALATVVLSA